MARGFAKLWSRKERESDEGKAGIKPDIPRSRNMWKRPARIALLKTCGEKWGRFVL